MFYVTVLLLYIALFSICAYFPCALIINRLKAEEQLRELQQSNWTDQFTSTVILQFTLFHPPTNLFATVSLILELPPLGVTFTSNHISIVYLYKYITAMDNLVLACEVSVSYLIVSV